MSNTSSGVPLNSAYDDSNQTMSSAPIGSAVQTCGSVPPDKPNKKHWIGIELVDESGKPVPGEDYRIILPDGSMVEDSLDSKGRSKIADIDPGNCQVCFPNIDRQIWKKG